MQPTYDELRIVLYTHTHTHTHTHAHARSRRHRCSDAGARETCRAVLSIGRGGAVAAAARVHIGAAMCAR